MKTIPLISAILFCVACASPASDGAVKTYSSLAAPTPDNVSLVIKGDRNGQKVSVKVGTTIAVELVGAPTAGYVWTLAETPGVLEVAGEYGGPTSSAQLERGFAGGSHWEAFLFNVMSAGEGELRLEQRRPWESDEPPAERFSVNVLAEE